MKLVVCDIDNTLVVKHQSLTPFSKEMILQLQSQGWLFGLASGRTVPQLQELAQQWGVHTDLLIGLNGCELYDNLDQHYQKYYWMEKEWVKEALAIMEPFDTTPCGSRGEVWLSLNKGSSLEDSKKYLKNAKKNSFQVVEDVQEFYREPMDKICFRVSEEIMPEVEKRAAQFQNEHYKGIKTEKTMYEFCHIAASKGKMLELFCQKHQIALENVWAFGDMSNDIDMLETAGHSVCLLNGSDDAKAVSEYVTEKPISEDGWAHFVKGHLL